MEEKEKKKRTVDDFTIANSPDDTPVTGPGMDETLVMIDSPDDCE
ncbi:MAG: hypothetical protein PWQ91_1598 [Eubacteriales bacterium]|nr:hypothetical protein [Eubacteriales bacterium]MDN5364536.1 hypothetical protein [Eubacteriales bacterium]